jgi:MFS family permease
MANDHPPTPSLDGQLHRVWRSLRHRNFRLFFIGQGISVIGTWMQQVAMGWLVFRLTEDAFLMGMVTFAAQVPCFLLMPFVGVFVDRWNRHRVVIATQILALVQALILALLVLYGVVTYWQLIVLSVFLGCINAVDMPARQAFLPEMLTDKDDLANAIALNSSLFNGARLVGPVLATALIYLVGEATCFLLNAVSYVAVVAALLAMILPPRPRRARQTHPLRDLLDGLRYAFGFPPIRAIILLVAMMSLVAVPYSVLMPLFAKDILHGGVGTFGLLTTAAGLGALAGAIYMAWRTSVLGLGRRIVLAGTLAGLAMLAFSHSNRLWLSLALLPLVGLGIMVTLAGCNTILQTLVDDDKRGRVMSLYTMAFMGVAPFGSLLAGSLANWAGPRTTVLVSGLACLVGTFMFARRLGALRAFIRPIYVRKGILPAPTPALEAAPEVFVRPESLQAEEVSS